MSDGHTRSPTHPPLPPGPPPQQPAQAPLPPPMGFYQPSPSYNAAWGDAYQQPVANGNGLPFDLTAMPPVSDLLMREAIAWRALLGLHQGVLGTARQMASACGESDATLETAREAMEAREAQYYASLTTLVAQCDQLSAEALRLRSLRKARSSTDTHALQVLLQSHSTETLAIGSTLASNSTMNVQAVTVEMRQAAQATRQQIAQVRALMQLVQDTPRLRGKLKVAFVPDDGDEQSFTPEEVFASVYRQAAELTDESLVAAMSELCSSSSEDVREHAPSVEGDGDGGSPVATAPRQLVRRSTDRGRSEPGR